MPTGSAPHGGLPTQDEDEKDPLDAKLTWFLRCGSRISSLPDLDASPDEFLLRYVDGTLDREVHQVVERRLVDDHEARRRVSLLKSALAESLGPAPPNNRILLYLSEGKLRLLRSRQGAEPQTPGGTVLIAMPDLGPGAELQLRAMDGAVGVQLRGPGVTGVTLRNGVTALAEAKADGEGGFHLAAVAPARHDLRVHRGAEEVSLVLDIRTG